MALPLWSGGNDTKILSQALPDYLQRFLSNSARLLQRVRLLHCVRAINKDWDSKVQLHVRHAESLQPQKQST